MDKEQEFNLDLGRYVFALRKWHRLIILCAVIAGALALGISFLVSPTYESEAVVAIVRNSVQVNFDPKIKTVSQVDMAYDPTALRKSLTTIAKSPDVASAVIAQIGDRLHGDRQTPAALTDSIVATNDGDLIRIKATSTTSATAALLANTWAEEYTTRVNALYSESAISPHEIQDQATSAKSDYDSKEAALIAYLATNPTDKLVRQITETQQILGALQSGKDTAIKTVVNKEIETRSQIIEQYLSTQASNRLVAFVKEQEGKNKLLNSYLDSVIAARLAVFNQQSSVQIQKLADLYAIANKLDRLIADAAALRARLSSGTAGSARGDELASILLETSAFSTWSSLPVNLQIPIDQLSVGSTPADQLKNLDALLAAMKDRLKTVQADIDTQSKDLLNNPGYEFLDAQVFGQQSVVDAVKKQYPELFAIGDIASLTDALDTDNPLAKSVDEASRSLLQLDGLEKVIAYSSTNEPITKAVDQLQQEVNQLQSQLESESAKKQEIVRARDLAWSTYTTLANKRAEMGVSAQATGSVVRIATAAVPPAFSAGIGKPTRTFLGLVIGLLLGVGIALVAEFLGKPIRNEDQVNKVLGLPVVGAIPVMASLPKSTDHTGGHGSPPRTISINLAALDPRSPATEAYRVLRHALLSQDSMRRVIVVASATPSEGKSTVAANLAAIIARSGKRVILVDADFRRPSQHKLFGVKNNIGLSDILGGAMETWESCAQMTAVENLQLVTSGALPPDPAVLLESPELKRWLELLKQAVDIVIVDTPPTVGLADVLIVAQAADAVLLVVGVDMVSERDALRAKDLLAAQTPIVGVVLNRTDVLPGALTYAYYYAHRKESHLTLDEKPSDRKERAGLLVNVRDRIVEFVIPRKRL